MLSLKFQPIRFSAVQSRSILPISFTKSRTTAFVRSHQFRLANASWYLAMETCFAVSENCPDGLAGD